MFFKERSHAKTSNWLDRRLFISKKAECKVNLFFYKYGLTVKDVPSNGRVYHTMGSPSLLSLRTYLYI